MTMSVVGLSIDCADAAALAGFWSEVLGRPVNPGADAERAAIDATDPASGPRLSFQKVPEPKSVKNRLHLDLRTDRFEAESERLAGLGATALRSFERPTIRWTTFTDPEGNEFDLIGAAAPASRETTDATLLVPSYAREHGLSPGHGRCCSGTVAATGCGTA